MLLQCIKMNESKIPARLMACMRSTLQTATLLLYPKISLQTPSQLHLLLSNLAAIFLCGPTSFHSSSVIEDSSSLVPPMPRSAA